MRTVDDVNAVIGALTPLVIHSRKVAQDIAALQALRDDPASAGLANDVLEVVPLETLGKLKAAVDAFLLEAEPKAVAIRARELK